MNFRTTYWLFAALVGLIAVAAISLLIGPKPGDESLLFPSLADRKLEAKDIDRLTVERKQPSGEPLVFVRTGPHSWRLEKPYSARVDGNVVERVLGDILRLRRDDKTDTLSGGPASYGLDTPAVTLILSKTSAPEAMLSLNLGGLSASADPLLYVTSGEKPGVVVAVKKSGLASLFKTGGETASNAGELLKPLADFRSRDLLLADAGFNPSDAAESVKVTDGKRTLALVKKDGVWNYETPAGYGPADMEGDAVGAGSEANPPSGVKPLVQALANLKPGTTDDVIDTPTALADYGLEPGKEVGPKFEVRRKNPAGEGTSTEILATGKPDGTTGKLFARLEGERAVVKLPALAVAPLAKLLDKPSGLRDRALLPFPPTACDAVDVAVTGADSAELRKLGEPAVWKLLASDGSARNAGAQSVTSLLTALGGRLIREYPEPGLTEAALGFDRPSAEVTLWVGGILPDEKKPDEKKPDADPKAEPKKPDEPKPAKPKMKEPSAKLIFGKRDKDLVYVRRIVNGVKADAAIPESVLTRVTRGRLEYIDAILPSFVRETATKLEFNRDGQAVVAEKGAAPADGAPAPWTLKTPANLDGRLADYYKIDAMLGELLGLKPERLWAEKATDAQLERWGLKPPRVQATVTLNDKDKGERRDYLFGAETDDKQGVYAKQGGSDLVFVARKDVVTPFLTGELQDPYVARIDVAKVTGLKLTGWKDVVGTPLTREFARAGASNWTVKGDDKAKANAARCEEFLNTVANIKAERWAVHKGEVAEAMKLAVPAGALQIELLREGAEPVVVTVGGPADGGKLLYATVSSLAGDVVLVPAGPFEPVRAKPGYFLD